MSLKARRSSWTGSLPCGDQGDGGQWESPTFWGALEEIKRFLRTFLLGDCGFHLDNFFVGVWDEKNPKESFFYEFDCLVFGEDAVFATDSTPQKEFFFFKPIPGVVFGCPSDSCLEGLESQRNNLERWLLRL